MTLDYGGAANDLICRCVIRLHFWLRFIAKFIAELVRNWVVPEIS